MDFKVLTTKKLKICTK